MNRMLKTVTVLVLSVLGLFGCANAVVKLDDRHVPALQEKGEALLAGRTGAIVVMNSGNGRLLVSASNGSEKNLACEHAFSPGGTMELFLSAVGIDSGTIGATDLYECTGAYQVGPNLDRKCRRFKAHGQVNLASALRESCYAYFYDLSVHAGIDTLRGYAERLRYGVPAKGHAEGMGRFPDREREERARRQHNGDEFWRWAKGDTVQLATGQGHNIAVTPLQQASLMCTLLNGGHLVDPYGNEAGKNVLSTQTAQTVISALPRIAEETNLVGISGLSQPPFLVRAPGNSLLREYTWFVGAIPASHVAVVVLVDVDRSDNEVPRPSAKNIAIQLCQDMTFN